MSNKTQTAANPAQQWLEMMNARGWQPFSTVDEATDRAEIDLSRVIGHRCDPIKGGIIKKSDIIEIRGGWAIVTHADYTFSAYPVTLEAIDAGEAKDSPCCWAKCLHTLIKNMGKIGLFCGPLTHKSDGKGHLEIV